MLKAPKNLNQLAAMFKRGRERKRKLQKSAPGQALAAERRISPEPTKETVP